MLTALTVRDIVLIESSALEFAPGLNVLTGETGAGKSILLDALGLAAGGRAGARAGVRPGAAQGSAIAVFDPEKKHPARALLRESAMEADGEIILRRVISADGRTRAFVNDEPVGVALLRDLGAALVEVHGQADDRGLFDNATHRRLLDAFGNHEALAQDVAERFAKLEAARDQAEELRRAAAAAEADAEYTRHAADELTSLGAEEGEEAAITSARALLMNATKIAEDVSAASAALSGERGAEAGIASALKRLSRMNEEARKAATAAETALEQAYALTEDARRELDSLLASLKLNPRELEKKEERLYALRDAARKYNVQPDALPRLQAEFEAKRESLETGGSKVKTAEAAVEQARETYLAAARKLSAARKKSASELDASVATELTPLKLAHAKFRVNLEPLESETANGLERVAFEVATVEGATFGSLAKIASGGELARFSLALKVALSEASPPAALVFDEVDRGVGGAVADAVGERLQRLAKTTQVLLVTHSPQVAARAARHFRITRLGDKTRVHALTDDERLEELARMLSGANVTEEARAAARRLIAEATPKRKKRA
ncbi:MAG TPA: DNA repair protein RecN [Rhizomicrobium sp.]|jgi:DNA repair protein RecN (Recombination protein N)